MKELWNKIKGFCFDKEPHTKLDEPPSYPAYDEEVSSLEELNSLLVKQAEDFDLALQEELNKLAKFTLVALLLTGCLLAYLIWRG